jgi:hypothetical protein
VSSSEIERDAASPRPRINHGDEWLREQLNIQNDASWVGPAAVPAQRSPAPSLTGLTSPTPLRYRIARTS